MLIENYDDASVYLCVVAHRTILELSKGEWGTNGRMECPRCKALTLTWYRSAVNGHVHAKCTTPRCLAFCE